MLLDYGLKTEQEKLTVDIDFVLYKCNYGAVRLLLDPHINITGACVGQAREKNGFDHSENVFERLFSPES